MSADSDIFLKSLNREGDLELCNGVPGHTASSILGESWPVSFFPRWVVDKIPPAVIILWGSHDLDGHTTVHQVSESLPVLWIHVLEKPSYINNQGHTRVLIQKFPYCLRAFPAGTPGQEPDDGAVDRWVKMPFRSDFS